MGYGFRKGEFVNVYWYSRYIMEIKMLNEIREKDIVYNIIR